MGYLKSKLRVSSNSRLGLLTVIFSVACSATVDGDGSESTNSQGGVSQSDAQTTNEVTSLPANLECESVLMCDSHRLPRETVTMPLYSGGTIDEGLYKAVAGVTQPLAIAFNNQRFSHVSWNLLTGNGSYVIEDNVLTTQLEVACSPNSEPGGNFLSQPIVTSYYFEAIDDELYLNAFCVGARCDPVIKLQRVDSLCSDEALSREECQISSCSCHEFYDQGMPDRTDGEDQCAL